MLQFAFIRTAILCSDRPFQLSLRVKNQRLARRVKTACACADIHRSDTTGKNRTYYEAGHNVFLRLEERLDHSVDRSATRYAAGNLRDHEARELQLRMPRTEFDQYFRHLLRGGDSDIRDHTAMQC